MADITTIRLPSNIATDGASSADAQKLKSYLYQLTEQLRYVLSNLDTDNMSSSYNAGQTGVATQIGNLSEQEQSHFEQLKKDIIKSAQKLASEYQSDITIANDLIKAEVEERYSAQSESLEARLNRLVSSELSQTSRDFYLSLTSVSEIAQKTADALSSFSSETETWFRFTEAGLELGKSENGETVPYTMRIDNEKLAFLHYGQVVAFLQYDRLYISAAEVSDRISIGGSAGEGYYDFITTATGLGIKWRAN